jgi:hypothetical protein
VPPNGRSAGQITDSERGAYLVNAGALAFPPLTEGFGLPFEAMAPGGLVLVAPCAAVPDVYGKAAPYADPFSPGSAVSQRVGARGALPAPVSASE